MDNNIDIIEADISKGDTSAIYIADLADYNDGILRGIWIDPMDYRDVDDLGETIQKFLAIKGHEEYAIHDYNNFPDLGEYPSLDNIWEVSKAILDHDANLVKGYLNYFGIDQLSELDDRYQGTYKDLEDYACQFCEDTGMLSQVPENLKYYFDYERLAKDWDMSGDIICVDVPEGVAIFSSY